MTKYTSTHGKHIFLCDQCKRDIFVGENVHSISFSKVEDGYVTKDYEKTETILCIECANTISRLLAITGTRYADSLAIQEAV